MSIFSKHAWGRLLRVSLYLLAIVIVVIAIALNVARVLMPRVQGSRDYLEHWASQVLERPVHFSGVTAAWRGLSPVFQFSNLEVYDTHKKRLVLAVKNLGISVSLWESLLNKRLVPGHVEVFGTNLHIKQLTNTEFKVNNMLIDFADTSGKSKLSDFSWLLHTGFILTDADVYWRGMHNNTLHLSPTRFTIKSDGKYDLLAGAFTVKQANAATISFSVRLDTHALKQQHLKMQAYIAGSNISLVQAQNLLQSWIPIREKIRGGKTDMQLWVNVANNQLQHIVSKLSLHYFGLQGWHLRHRLFMPHFQAVCSWKRKPDGWLFQVSRVQVHLPGMDWPDNRFSWRYKTDSNDAYSVINVGFLRLQDFPTIEKQFSGWPKQLLLWDQRLAPTGDVHDLRVNWSKKSGFKALALNLQNSSWRAWGKIPGMQSVNADLSMNTNSGQVYIFANPGKLAIPDLYAHSLQYQQFVLPLRWQRHKTDWKVAGSFAATLPAASAYGRIHIHIPGANQSPIVDLLSGFSVQDLSQVKSYIPKMSQHKKLHDWLYRAFVSGRISNGVMLLRGPLSSFPFDDHSGHFEVVSSFNKFNFHYANLWPNVLDANAKLIFDNRSMSSQIYSANLLGLNVAKVQAGIPDMQHSKLSISGDIYGKASAAVKFMRATPLQVAKAFDSLDMSGAIQGNVHLYIPLDYSGTNHTWGSVTANNSNLILPRWRLNLSALRGKVSFKDDVLSAPKLSAVLFAKPVSVSMHTKSDKQSNYLHVQVGGKFSGPAVRKYLGIPDSRFWTGESSYIANLSIYMGSHPSTVAIDVKGKGNKLDLPAYFYKPAAKDTALLVHMQLLPHDLLNLRLMCGRRWNVAMKMGMDNNVWGIHAISIFSGSKAAPLPSKSGFFVYGYLPELKWSEWQKWLVDHKLDNLKSGNLKKGKLQLQRLDMRIGKLNYKRSTWHNIKIGLISSPKLWHATVASTAATGTLSIPKSWPHGTLDATFKHLNLQPLSSKNPQLQILPNLNISIDSFAWAGHQYGRVVLHTSSTPDSLTIKTIQVNSKDFSFSGSGDWRKYHTKQKSQLQGKLSSDDFGALLASFNYSDLLSDGKGSIAINLNWPNSLFRVRDSNLSGTVKVDIYNGRITKISKSAESEMGIGRVLSLLSLQTLPRRLTLNFDDLFKSGYSFNDWQGDWLLNNGVANTENTSIDGPVAKVILSGSLDFPGKNYNLLLRVQPYLTGSLPVIATVVGTPIAGAITWMVNKVLISPIVGRVMESSYHVKGSWDKPKVKMLPAPSAQTKRG